MARLFSASLHWLIKLVDVDTKHKALIVNLAVGQDNSVRFGTGIMLHLSTDLQYHQQLHLKHIDMSWKTVRLAIQCFRSDFAEYL